MAKADGLLPNFLHFQTHIKYTDECNVEVQLENVTDHDWVEVVRCGDCRYYPIEGTGGFDLKWPIDGYNCPFCVDDEYYSAKPEKDGYCSMGKRREPND